MKILFQNKKGFTVLEMIIVVVVLGILMAASEDGADAGHKIYILNPSEIVKLAIASTGFSEVFPVIHSFDEVK